MKTICFEIGERYCFEFDAIGSDGDHVHLFVGAEPECSLSRVMQIMKSITSRQIFKQYPEIKKQLWGGELLSDGGYIGIIGDGATSDVIKIVLEIKEIRKKKKHISKEK